AVVPPPIGVNDSARAGIQEGGRALGGYPDNTYRTTHASEVLHQITDNTGPRATSADYYSAMTQTNKMLARPASICLARPNVVKTVTNETVSAEELGGASRHYTKSGVAHTPSANDVECLEGVKRLLSYIPQNSREVVEDLPYELGDELREQLNTIVPDNANKPYDMHDVINNIIDEDSFFEIHKNYAENIIVGFARIGGKSVGIVANNPMFLAGCLDVNSSIRSA